MLKHWNDIIVGFEFGAIIDIFVPVVLNILRLVIFYIDVSNMFPRYWCGRPWPSGRLPGASNNGHGHDGNNNYPPDQFMIILGLVIVIGVTYVAVTTDWKSVIWPDLSNWPVTKPSRWANNVGFPGGQNMDITEVLRRGFEYAEEERAYKKFISDMEEEAASMLRDAMDPDPDSDSDSDSDSDYIVGVRVGAGNTSSSDSDSDSDSDSGFGSDPYSVDGVYPTSFDDDPVEAERRISTNLSADVVRLKAKFFPDQEHKQLDPVPDRFSGSSEKAPDGEEGHSSSSGSSGSSDVEVDKYFVVSSSEASDDDDDDDDDDDSSFDDIFSPDIVGDDIGIPTELVVS